MSSSLSCPACRSTNLADATSVFIEYGEFDGRRYDEEGYADVLRCVDCAFQFADLDTFALDTVSVDD